jgi:alkylated DNA repair dioxygenase AlkB
MLKDIFGQTIETKVKKEPIIEGMSYISDWITENEHDTLLNEIDKMPWETTLKRRVQQYGYRYDYRKAKNMVMSHKENYIGPLPEFLQNIAIRLHQENIFTDIPDEILVNEYMPGQGIANHVDCLPCFSDVVVSLSLGSQCIMDLKKDTDTVYKHLEKNSILILSGESRYLWSHGIRTNKSDIINGKWVPRTRRVSVTFRKTIF